MAIDLYIVHFVPLPLPRDEDEWPPLRQVVVAILVLQDRRTRHHCIDEMMR